MSPRDRAPAPEARQDPDPFSPETGEEGDPGAWPWPLPWRKQRVSPWPDLCGGRGAGLAEGLILAPTPPRGRGNGRVGVGERLILAPKARSDPWWPRREAGWGGGT